MYACACNLGYLSWILSCIKNLPWVTEGTDMRIPKGRFGSMSDTGRSPVVDLGVREVALG